MTAVLVIALALFVGYWVGRAGCFVFILVTTGEDLS